MLGLAGCGVAEQPGGATYADYRLVPPEGFVRDDSGVAIDSKVERWTSADAEISTDFGQHGGEVDCPMVEAPCSVENREVDGQPASVTRQGPDAAGAWRVRVFVPLHVIAAPGTRRPLSLVLDATCRSEARCDALVPVLLSADLIEGPPPWQTVASAPRPPIPR